MIKSRSTNRILVIRGGAIGDFVLTLPAIRLLRDRFPEAHLEILGYPHITALAHRRGYADAIRSIEQGSLARFFAADSDLSEELIDYFASFDLIVSYLFDANRIFEASLRRCRIQRLIVGPSKLAGQEHGALQLARPLEQLGLRLMDPGARLFPNNEDRKFARHFLGDDYGHTTAIHSGSGSETKNWPIENWEDLGEYLFFRGHRLLLVSGEADEDRADRLESGWKGKPIRFAKNLSLPHLAALFENATFLGHDSGISHIAAAVGARCYLLFGPTDPNVWAPANRGVSVIQAPARHLRSLSVEAVVESVNWPRINTDETRILRT